MNSCFNESLRRRAVDAELEQPRSSRFLPSNAGALVVLGWLLMASAHMRLGVAPTVEKAARRREVGMPIQTGVARNADWERR